jgi:hypothetical protein
LKVTFPVGFPPVEVTVAVNIVCSPGKTGFTDDTSVVVVGARFTT